MPTAEHETPLQLTKLEPNVVTWLLTHVFDLKVPNHHHARAQPTEVRVLVPHTYHADGMLLFCDEADAPVLAVVQEIQRGWDEGKRRTWKLYVAHLEVELNVDTALLVYCPDPAIAERYRDLFQFDGPCLSLRPLIFTPDDVPLVVDVDLARTNPALALLSAVCHSRDTDLDSAFPALAAALQAIAPKKRPLYYDVVLAGLPAATRARWEAFMSTTAGYQFHSETFRKIAADAEAHGEARAVLTVLEGRDVAVPIDVRERILACTDLAQLDTWLRRAITATAIDEVVTD